MSAGLRLTVAEYEALCAAVDYAQSYWEEDGAPNRARARAAGRAIDKIRTRHLPRARPDRTPETPHA
jgi:hypothetical protein